MIEFINRLGTLVDRFWQEKARDTSRFPEVAMRALQETRPAAHLSPEEIIDWVHRTSQFPNQNDPAGAFGEPPVTVYVGDNFHIDIYFWLDSTTMIHEHSFCGAFTLLAGSSIQGIYNFEEAYRLHEHLRVGPLTIRELKYLKKGEMNAILPGHAFIHNVIHLHRPTVTLLIRTSCPEVRYQFNFLRPNLSLIAFRDCSPQLQRSFQFLNMLRKTDFPGFLQQTKRFLAEADSATCAQMIMKMVSIFGEQSGHLSRIINELFFDQADLFEVLNPVLKRENRNGFLMNLRRLVFDPEQRFLCAALSLCDDRPTFFRLMKDHYPAADPIQQTCLLTREIASKPEIQLGFSWSAPIETALQGHMAGKTRDELLESTPPEQREQIAQAYDHLTASKMFRFPQVNV